MHRVNERKRESERDRTRDSERAERNLSTNRKHLLLDNLFTFSFDIYRRES